MVGRRSHPSDPRGNERALRLELTLVIPCYNEEACIEEVVSSWVKEISRRISGFSIVVVDDGSKDQTPQILQKLKGRYPELKVIRQQNQGHGAALLTGYKAAEGTWVFHTDSDNQFVPEDFWKLWELRNETPYVIGIRMNRDDPWFRLIISRILRLISRVLTGVPVRDLNIPYKLIRKDLLDQLLPSIPSDTFAPSILLVLGAHYKGVSFRQVEVKHLPRTTGETVLRPWRLFRSCLQAFRQLAQYWFAVRKRWPKEL